MLLPVLALSTALLGESAGARQGEASPGIAIETLGRSLVGGSVDELVLLRVTIEPSASVPASDGPSSAVILLEEGRVGVALEGTVGEASLTLAGGNGTVPLTSGSETILDPGDAVSSGDGTRLTLHNAGDGEAMLLYAVVIAAGDSPFATSAEDATGKFSVETFACPEGMTLATLETDACDPSSASLVRWSLASEQFDAPLGADEATVSGATTTWKGCGAEPTLSILPQSHLRPDTATISFPAATRSRVRMNGPHASTSMRYGLETASTPMSSWAMRPRPEESDGVPGTADVAAPSSVIGTRAMRASEGQDRSSHRRA